MSPLIPNPMLSPTPPPQQGQISAPPTDDPNFAVAPVGSIGLPGQYALPAFNSAIQRVPPRAGDATYLSDEAKLRSDTAQQYQKLLSQLGQGNIPGTVAQDANIKLAQYQHDLQSEAEKVTQNAQQTGTVFSGTREQALADAQYPTYQSEADTQLQAGRSLQDLYSQAQDLVSSYNTSNNQLLAAAAARQAALATKAPGTVAPGSTPAVGGAISANNPQDALHGSGVPPATVVHPPPHVAQAIAGVHAATVGALAGQGNTNVGAGAGLGGAYH